MEAYDRIQGQYLRSLLAAEAASALVRVGRRADAEDLLKAALGKRDIGYVDPFTIAGFYAALDSVDHYFQWMEQAYRERSSFLPWLEQLQPSSPSIREDSRYQTLLNKLSTHN